MSPLLLALIPPSRCIARQRARRLAAALLPLWLGATLPLAAQVYRYVDEQGVTVFSQHPPPGAAGTPVESVPVAPPPPAAATEAARERLREQIEQSFDQREAQAQSAAEARVAAAEAAERASACAAARTNLETLQGNPARRLWRPDGTLFLPSAAERDSLIAEARAQIEAHCDD